MRHRASFDSQRGRGKPEVFRLTYSARLARALLTLPLLLPPLLLQPPLLLRAWQRSLQLLHTKPLQRRAQQL